MNTKENNYSLLREFNLEQAQAGDEILHILSPSFTYTELLHEVKFKGVTSNLQEVFLEDKQGEGYVCGTQRVKMKPLCWLEGKPVYKGDKLWYKSKADNNYYQHEAWSITSDHLFDEGSFGFVDVSLLSWDKPQPHVHQELIDAYNKGAEIQYWSCLTQDGYEWKDISKPSWCVRDKYRIKPQKKAGWINIWKCSSATGVSTGSQIYLSKGDALAGLLGQWDWVDTVEITWME
jgi:hypothetical protein